MTLIEENQLELTHTGVYIHRHDHIIVPTIVDEYAEDRRDHAIIYHRMDDEWLQQLIDDNSICGVCSIQEPKERIFAMGVDGRVDIANLPGFSVEYVDQSHRRPNYSATIRCVRRIGNRVFAAGMARQVYARMGDNIWRPWDQGTYLPRGQRTEAVGFLDLDGFPDGRLFAVGYKGEIWFFDGKKWQQEDSPTNVALTCIACVSDDDIVIGGLTGTLIRGNHARWRVIDQDVTEANFWGITIFQASVFVSNYDGVFVLQDDALAPVDMGFEHPISTAYLHAADGIMCSVGHKDIAMTNDGKRWQEIEKP